MSHNPSKPLTIKEAEIMTQQWAGTSSVPRTATGQPQTIGYFKTIDNPGQSTGIQGIAQTVAFKTIEPVPPVNRHKAHWLTWDGNNYVPSFIPEKIKMVMYDEKDYLEVVGLLQKERINTSFLNAEIESFKKDMESLENVNGTLHRTNANIMNAAGYLHDMYYGKSKILSAKAYLRKVDGSNYLAQRVLTEALIEYENEQEAIKDINEKYSTYDDAVHVARVRLRAMGDHIEERSL